MADNRGDILHELSYLATLHGAEAIDAGFDRLMETRLGRTHEGREALAAAERLATEYGPRAIEELIHVIQRRQAAKTRQRATEAHAVVDDAAERARERIRAGSSGEGHQ